MRRAQSQAQVVINAESTTKQELCVCAILNGCKNVQAGKIYGFFVRSKVFLSSKAALGWSETQLYANNEFGHFSHRYILYCQHVTGRDSATTCARRGQHLKSPSLCSAAVFRPLYHLQGQGRITPLPVSPRWRYQPSPPPRSTCL